MGPSKSEYKHNLLGPRKSLEEVFLYFKKLYQIAKTLQYFWIYSLLGTPIYSRSLERKKVPAFWLLPKFSLILGLLKSRISKNSFELLLRKLDFKLFHYKARVQPVSKITTMATRNRC